ncbi:tyrosinase family oxidase copper chaperone [Streptomyces coelicoflavus]|uniref:tyrosinase family oxidase copper chaperone n=1 Tax=Streptomyces coelicoflavus TaxID=285562 RepID=UPI00224F1E32|nr:tyrosinase family oxidase copper chaperone [Streptomyces coelicoflavus]MCX5037768.1 tyrosinase cofactor [Streptomyces coelicoflavus]
MAVNAGTRTNGTEGERRRAAQGEGAERGGPAKPGQAAPGPVNPGQVNPGQVNPGPASGTRRQVMRGLLAPALAVGLAPLVAASRPARATEAAAGAGDAAGPAHPGPHAAGSAPLTADSTAFDETYRGRRIRGIRSAAGRAVGAGTWHVTVDGRPLHLMRRADGSWLSMIDHYRSYPTPLAAARGAVDELGPGEHLRDTPSTGHDQHPGGRHGVHA